MMRLLNHLSTVLLHYLLAAIAASSENSCESDSEGHESVSDGEV